MNNVVTENFLISGNKFSNTSLLLLLIIIVGLYFRVTMVVETKVDYPVRADAKQYISYAYNIIYNKIYSKDNPFYVNADDELAIKKNVKPDALRTPGYPLFIALFIQGNSLDVTLKRVCYAQAILSTLVIVLVFFLLSSIIPKSLALLAALLTAISPHLISMNVYFLTEALFIFILFVHVFFLLKMLDTSNKYYMVFTGVTLGLAFLVKPVMTYMPWFLIALVVINFNKKKAFIFSISFLIGYGIFYIPWACRNFIVLGDINPSSLGVESIHNGMYLGFMYEKIPESYGRPYAFVPNFKDIQSMSTVLLMVYERFLQEPFLYAIWYLFEKPRIFLSWDIIQGMGDVFIYPVIKSPYESTIGFTVTHSIMKNIQPILNILALLCTVAVWLPTRITKLSDKIVIAGRGLAVILIYFLLIHIVATPLPRYAIPIYPIIYCLSIIMLYSIYNCLLHHKGCFKKIGDPVRRGGPQR